MKVSLLAQDSLNYIQLRVGKVCLGSMTYIY